MVDTRTKVLDAATLLMQTRGYNGFSFHDLSEMVGIKTASIHYYFPTKIDLGRALTSRYTAAFMEALGVPDLGEPDERLALYISLFRDALANGRMCLCGMVGAEIGGVPDELGVLVREFFTQNEVWLMRVFERSGAFKDVAKSRAVLCLAALEGAMIVARTSQDSRKFEDVANLVLMLAK